MTWEELKAAVRALDKFPVKVPPHAQVVVNIPGAEAPIRSIEVVENAEGSKVVLVVRDPFK